MSFFGKYRGKIENNVDPLMQGRVQISCPLVLGSGTLSWAMPCTPYAGSGVGFYAIPPRGANIWVEFEGGDPDRPIWTGCFWGLGELPTETMMLPQVMLLKTPAGLIKLNELPGVGGISIETPAGMKINISVTGIEISNGMAKISLMGPQVSVNDGALEVI